MIAQPDPFNDLCVLMNGYDQTTPACIAWALEKVALNQGWPVGRFLGSETDLIEHFHVSRNVLREAIRMVEARGSMRMRRGCKGGLHLISPNLDHAAGALATYLRACGCSDVELTEAATVADPIFSGLRKDSLIVRLYERTFDLLAADEPADVGLTARGPVIAMRLIQRRVPIPKEGVYLGSEEELCAKFNSCRSTFRQALRILDDLGMLRVRRGRGGGYSLQRPAAIGVVRQLFALLASRQQTVENIEPVVCALNIVNLRLALRQLRRLSAEARAQRCDVLSSLLVQSSEPRRWGLLQHALGQIAANTVVNTLQHSVVAYYVRLGPMPWARCPLDAELHVAEEALVEAIRSEDDIEAERLYRSVQTLLTQWGRRVDLQGSDLALSALA